jgi:hypothetical protein
LLGQLNPIDPAFIQMPVNPIPAIAHLPIHAGFICTVQGCCFVIQSAKWMKTHCREKHNDTRLQQASLVQTLFTSTKSQYFPVIRVYPTDNTASEEELQLLVDNLVDLNTIQDQLALNASHTGKDNLGNTDQSSWLKRTGWTKYLAGLDRALLVKRVELPTSKQEENHRLAALFASFQ